MIPPPLSPLSVLPSRTLYYYPIIVATDGGGLTTDCQLLIAVYEFKDTVTITMQGNAASFNSDVFARLLEDILSDVLGYDIDIQVANITADGVK